MLGGLLPCTIRLVIKRHKMARQDTETVEAKIKQVSISNGNYGTILLHQQSLYNNLLGTVPALLEYKKQSFAL